MSGYSYEEIGRRLFSEGLLSANFGNLSVRTGEGFLITASGSFLDDPGDLVFVSSAGNPSPGASSEYRVHLEAYRATEAQAIVHAHPPFSVAASFSYDAVLPEDSEGKMLCPVIPVVHGEPGTDELAENVAEGLRDSPVVIARGHGTFATGKSLTEAYLLTSIAEHACKVLYYMGGFGGRRL